MNYQRYRNARDAAWMVLIRHGVRELPVDVKQICAGEGIMLLPYSDAGQLLTAFGLCAHAKRADGFSMRYGNRILLFYNDKKPRCRQRFTIGHELGHYLNGDISEEPTKANAEPGRADDPLETAANLTAARILAPACVLWHMGIFDARGIAKACDISITAARFRAKRLKALMERDLEFRWTRGRSCFLQSPLERQVYQNFFGNGN